VAQAQQAAAQKKNKTAATHPDKTSSQTGPHSSAALKVAFSRVVRLNTHN